ncbi:MAG: SDR family oxidoreductase [Cyanobacteria bacterium Co-bin8]|nr:SDR family oxidoreductase [Cyanobacteria bacterium Co-bin8]
MPEISRRHMLAAGTAGVAGFAVVATQAAQANQNSPAPQVSANPNGRFADKVVLITGATSGIGEVTARAFAAEGATVHFCGRREALGEQIAQSIRATGGRATYQKADVRIEDDVKAFVDGCLERYGQLDIAFNNAGIFVPTSATVADTDVAAWNDVMTTNASGVFYSMKYELPPMVRQQSGVIINNASVSGHVAFGTISPYTASKHAIIGLTKVAAVEYAAQNIRVNSISPGAVDTPQLAQGLRIFGATPEQAAQGYPIKRIVAPQEIASVVMWLSESSSCVVGTDIDVTGGYLTH